MAAHDRTPALTVGSDDGAVRYVLRATQHGLLVERTRWRKGMVRLSVATVFRTNAQFARWCDADSVRFDYPMLHAQLRRQGSGLLQPASHGLHHAG